MKLEAANIETKHPGILEVPDGKNVEDLPQSHFEKLIDKKGYEPIIRALTNLEVWNKEKNKSLSKWASDMADKLKKKFRPESRLRSLIESAKGINENMQYRVYAYDDENKLVDTSKVFDCLCKAQEYKNDYAKKHPTYTIEISSLLNQPESSQKNEDFYKYIDDVPTREIAKALKELGIKEPYATQKAKIADKLAKRFGLRNVPSPIEMTKILDALPYFTGESAQKFESKVNMSKLKNEIQAAVNKYFKDDKDLLEYVYIDTKKDKFGRDILEVRAELGYNDMVKLADYLDKIITKYDKYAYFDQETSGIMIAVFESAQKNEATSDRVNINVYYDGKKISSHDIRNYLPSNYNITKITAKPEVIAKAQKNETSLRDLNLDLSEDTNAIIASADKIRQRFEYRTLQNQSYDEKQAEKIYLEIRRELEKAKKLIDACYNKIG